MNKLTPDKQAAIVRCLVDGNSVRATCRITGTAKGTILKLLVHLGYACGKHHSRLVRNVKAGHIECDEQWCYVYAKDKNVPKHMVEDGAGSAWTWCCMDADSKLVISWCVGERNATNAHYLMDDLARRVVGHPQISTDSLHFYPTAVRDVFENSVDHATITKYYNTPEDAKTEARYSPGKCTGCRKVVQRGRPDPAHISTSHIERLNLTTRMNVRRFTRLTNAFSKKLANLIAAVNLHFFYYNFCRIHQTIRMTPAMKAGVVTRVWTVKDVLNLLASIKYQNGPLPRPSPTSNHAQCYKQLTSLTAPHPGPRLPRLPNADRAPVPHARLAGP